MGKPREVIGNTSWNKRCMHTAAETRDRTGDLQIFSLTLELSQLCLWALINNLYQLLSAKIATREWPHANLNHHTAIP